MGARHVNYGMKINQAKMQGTHVKLCLFHTDYILAAFVYCGAPDEFSWKIGGCRNAEFRHDTPYLVFLFWKWRTDGGLALCMSISAHELKTISRP
jgi:hypothetical protein